MDRDRRDDASRNPRAGAAASDSVAVRPGDLTRALLRGWPGRLILIGLAVKLALLAVGFVIGPLPAVLRGVDTVSSLAIAAGAGFFLIRGLSVARRHLLWRVRRKLIISYIFIGFVPALLIAAFFLLSGVLLFYNFSSYLLQERLQNVADRARWIAQTAASDIERSAGRDIDGILERRQAAAVHDFSAASFAAVPVDRECGGGAAARGSGAVPPRRAHVAGPWAHLEPPTELPAWLGCEGFSGLLAYRHETALPEDGARTGPPALTPGEDADRGADGYDIHLLLRAVVLPEAGAARYAVVVDVPVTGGVKEQLRSATGVELSDISLSDSNESDVEVLPLSGRSGGDQASGDAATPFPLPSLTFLPFTEWASGRTGTLLVSMRLSIAEVYERIAEAPGRVRGNTSWGFILVALLSVVGGAFLVIEIVALGAGLALARSITGSVHELAEGTERVRQGDFTHKIAVTAQDQLGELAQSFNSMTASIEGLLREAAEKKRLEEELRIAHEIQMSLLPQGPLQMPGLSMTALCVPAREVGGDYYDFLPLDDRRVGLLIADVSGKGTSAALYMAELKGLVLSLSRIHTSPRALLIEANRIIAEHLDARSFITITFAVVDLGARTMTYSRAGHTPLIYLPGGDPPHSAQILTPDGLVLGLNLDGGRTFERLLEEQTLPLRPGDVYLFFTDGISEAMNQADDPFGEQRLARLVETHARLPPEEHRERLLEEIASFVGDAPQHDDMTLILLKVDAPVSMVPVAPELPALVQLP
jgi:sigma-B regulation protein RsbU (phosphoserine phosphatase)